MAAAATARRIWRIRALDGAALLAGLDRLGTPAGPAGYDSTEADVEIGSDAEAAELLAALVRDGVPVVAIHPAAGVLEQAYLTLTEDRR
jgi:hypothetical protein